MASNFKKDLEKARKAEHIVCDVLNSATIDYGFEEVGDVEAYYYKGDIKVTGFDDNICFVEVKDDSRIAETGNVLCEYKVYNYRNGKWLHGNMESDYDYYAVVAQQTQTIYVIDFDVLKKNYKGGRAYFKDHYDDNGCLSQKTVGTLCSLKQIEHWGGLLHTLHYREKDGNYYLA